MKGCISIIIPVYNAESYIDRCLSSLLEQTYTNWEAILINDGSTDRSGYICSEYANKDCRFHIIHQNNCGASMARNAGVNKARSEWITFIDADDYIDSSYLETLQKHISSEKATLVIQGLKQVSKDGVIKKVEFPNANLSCKEFETAFERKRIFEHGYTVAKLYNSEIIKQNNIRFNNRISYSEDLLFMLEYLLYCTNIRFIEGCGYNYVVDVSNLSQRYNSFNSEFRLFIKYTTLNNAIAKKFAFKTSESSLNNGALILMRSIYAIYINKEYQGLKRIRRITAIHKKYGSYIANYYNPKLRLFRIIKSALRIHPLLFDIVCVVKFR